MPLNGPAIGAVAVGAVFVYSGIKGYSVLKTVQNVISGTPGNIGQTATNPLSGGGSNTSGNTGGTSAGGGGNPPPTPDPGSNMALMKSKAAAYGWNTGAEWSALYQLEMSEAGFDNTIWNGGGHSATQPANSSGAFGIPQALPYSKMPKAAWPTGYGGNADAGVQIDWMLQYIKGRYGDPIKAWAFHQANNYY